MVSRLGLTGLPFTNVINGCATGGASLLTARDAIAAGTHQVGLVVGAGGGQRPGVAVAARRAARR
jgi:acetyl-CoA C-acetyltransferase